MRLYRSNILFSAAGVLFLGGSICLGGQSAGDRLDFASGLYARGMYELAAAEYAAWLSESKGGANADMVHYRLGECFLRTGNTNAADREFAHVFDSFPKSPFNLKAGFRRADISMQAGKYGPAVKLFDAVLGKGPDAEMGAACRYYKAECLLNSGDTNRAVEVFSEVAAKDGGTGFYSFALMKLGALYRDLGKKPEEIIEAYSKARMKAASGRVAAEAMYQIADTYFRQKQFEKSTAMFGELVKSYPDDTRTREAGLQAAWAAYNAGKYDEAMAFHGRASGGKGTGDEAEWLYLAANCGRRTEKDAEAAANYDRLLGKFGSSRFAGSARYELAATLYRMGNFKRAAEEALKVDPDGEYRRESAWLLAEAYSAMKDAGKAVKYYRKLVDTCGNEPIAGEAAYRAGFLMQDSGEKGDAVPLFRKTVEILPRSDLAAKALFSAANCYLGVKKFQEAAAHFSELIRDYAGHALAEESYYQRGLIEVRDGKDDEALKTFADLAAKFPKSKFLSDAYYWQGVMLNGREDYKKAISMFELSEKAGLRQELKPQAKVQKGTALYKVKRYDEALDTFYSLLGDAGEKDIPPAMLEWMSVYLAEKKKYDESARAALLLALEKDDKTLRQAGNALAGRALLLKGEKRRAVELFEKVLADGVEGVYAADSALKLGDLSYQEGKFDEASKYYDISAKNAGDDQMIGVRARAYAGLGKSAKAAGNDEGAARYFMSVGILFEDPEIVPECMFEAAQALMRLGRKDEAAKLAKELRARYPSSRWVTGKDSPN